MKFPSEWKHEIHVPKQQYCIKYEHIWKTYEQPFENYSWDAKFEKKTWNNIPLQIKSLPCTPRFYSLKLGSIPPPL